MHLTRSVKRGLKIAAGLLCSFTFVTPVLAYLSVDVSCSEYQLVTVNGFYYCSATPNASPDPGQVYSTALSGTAGGNSYSAVASGKADYGTLGVSAFATATNVTAANVTGDGKTFQLLAQSWSQWGDTLTVGGAAGTMVDVLVTLDVDISAFDISAISPPASNSMFSIAYLTFVTSFSPGGVGWCLVLGSPTACSTASPLHVGSNEISFTASFLAGTTTTWQSSLYAAAQVYNSALGDGTVTIDALNTAHSYFTVTTPGGTLDWASGHDYSLPPSATTVPEPETYAMIGLGLGLLGWVGRRKRLQAA